jgi:hypothetical protein
MIALLALERSAFAYSKAFHFTLSRSTDTRLAVHRLQEFLIGFRAMHLVHQEFHRFHRTKRTEDLSQNPHFVQAIAIDQKLFLSGTRLADIDGWENTLVCETSI